MSNNFEQFIQEVENDLRHEKFEHLWKKYGKAITTVFVVVIALSGAFNLWQHYQTKQRDTLSQQFVSAQSLLFNKNIGDALSAMEGISKASHRTYSTLAKFNMAAILRQETGHKDLNRVEEIYKDLMSSGTEHMFRELATVLFVGLRLERMNEDNAEEIQKLLKLIEPCLKEGAPYRHLALELRGMIELRQKNYPGAAETFVTIAQDDKAPKDLRSRAQVMTQNLAAQLASNAQGTGK
jgi:hypothetical protein